MLLITHTGKNDQSAEWKSRGNSEKFVIRSANVKVPSEFQEFLNNGDNKERLVCQNVLSFLRKKYAQGSKEVEAQM